LWVILGHCWAARVQVLLTIALTLGLGEACMRLPIGLRQLEYEPDADLDGRLAPSQVGYVWLANMSLQSPRITLNRDGHRGADTDWAQPVVLAVGDSEWFGAGVADDEVWTRHLERDLRPATGLERLQVVNAGHPGFGPYHEFVAFRRVLRAHRVEAVIVRVAIGQRNFGPVPAAERQQRLKAAQRRAVVRRVTKFLPFVFNKVEAQMDAVRAALVPRVLRRPAGGLERGLGRAMALEARPWWDALAALAEANNIPVVFVIDDVRGELPARELEAELRSIEASRRIVTVERLGPERFGLDPQSPAIGRIVRETLVLERDPHANSLQHRLLGRAVFDSLRDRGVLQRIRERWPRPAAPR